MRETKVKSYSEWSTLEVNSARMKMGRKYACLMSRCNLFNLSAYDFIIVFEDIEFDNTVDEI